jgi:hypothetical protein
MQLRLQSQISPYHNDGLDSGRLALTKLARIVETLLES